MFQELKKNVPYFLTICIFSIIMSIGLQGKEKIYGSAIFLFIAIVSGACPLFVVYGHFFSKKVEPRVNGINSGALNTYLTVNPEGFVSINLKSKDKMVAIPTAVKLNQLLSLEADQRIDIEGIVAVASEDLSKIDLYFPYNGSQGWLIIVRREDLFLLVK